MTSVCDFFPEIKMIINCHFYFHFPDSLNIEEDETTTKDDSNVEEEVGDAETETDEKEEEDIPDVDDSNGETEKKAKHTEL